LVDLAKKPHNFVASFLRLPYLYFEGWNDFRAIFHDSITFLIQEEYNRGKGK